MKSERNVRLQRSHKLRQAQVEGPNWILIIGGALLSTLSLKLGCMLKQAFDTKRSKNGKSMAKRMSEVCQLDSNLYCFGRDEESCYHCCSGKSEGRVDFKQAPASPASNEGDPHLPLVAISVMESTKDNGGVMWPSSPERLELPRKPSNHSTSSESPPCVSESGSDFFSKREVICKLREQVKRRDETILEMQAQLTAIQKSLAAQIAQSAHLQSQLDDTNRYLFDSEIEIQRLRKAIADHCMADAGSPMKPVTSQNWHADARNGHTNGYANGFADGLNDLEFNCAGAGKGRDSERVEMLKQEVEELKEVIGGKEFLLQSYREQKAELFAKLQELQLRLTSQVPNIL